MSNPGAEACNNPQRLATRNLCTHETVYILGPVSPGNCGTGSEIGRQEELEVWEIFLSARGFPEYKWDASGTTIPPQGREHGWSAGCVSCVTEVTCASTWRRHVHAGTNKNNH